MKENTLRRKVQDDMKSRGICCWHFAALGNGGFPDLLICHNEKTLFIETKGNHKTFSSMICAWDDLQRHCCMKLTRAGFKYWLIGSNGKEILFLEPLKSFEIHRNKDGTYISSSYMKRAETYDYILNLILSFLGVK